MKGAINLNVPLPKIPKGPELFLIIVTSFSHRSLQNREILRKTFLKNLPSTISYKFFVGDKYCRIPTKIRDQSIHKCPNCDCRFKKNYLQKFTYYESSFRDSNLDRMIEQIKNEKAEYKDVEILDLIDTYHNLTLKVKSGFRFAVNHENKNGQLKWVAKIDDDSILVLEILIKFLKNRYPIEKYPNLYLGIMKTNQTIRSQQKDNTKITQKWEEMIYKGKSLIDPVYPTYARGPFYLLSFDLAKFIDLNFDQLENYTCEDAAVGIWLDSFSEKKKINYVDESRIGIEADTHKRLNDLTEHRKYVIEHCRNLGHEASKIYCLGHNFDWMEIRRCYVDFVANFHGSKI